jgi:hypothetical protein
MRKIVVLAVLAVAVTGIFVWIESAVHSAALARASFSERWAAVDEATRSGTFRAGSEATRADAER